MEDNFEKSSWSSGVSKVSFLLLTLFLLISVIYLLRNVLHAIVLAAFLSVILSPIYRRLLRWIRHLFLIYAMRGGKRKVILPSVARNYGSRSRWIASLLMVLMVFCFISVPVCFLVINVARQGSRTIPSAEHWVRSEFPQKIEMLRVKYGKNRYVVKVMELLGEFELLDGAWNGEGQGQLTDIPPADDEDANGALRTNPERKISSEEMSRRIGEKLVVLLRSILNQIWQWSLKILSRTWITVFNFFIMLFVMFHLFHDGRAIWRYLKRISPLGDEEQRRVSLRIKEISRAVSFSIFGTAFAQGIMAMLFFRIVGIPALFWGFMLGICSIIPIVGTGLIWVPATIYLYLTGQTWQAVFILVTCGCFTANIDSLVRPLLMKQGGNTGMSYLVLFFSVLGGLQTFGLVGVIYGPLIMGICGICLLIFSTQFKAGERLNEESNGD